MKQYLIAFALVLLAVSPVAAKLPGAAVKNENANANACWGMDRSFYASQKFFPENMDIKQSFPNDVGEERRAWVETYCDPHGPVATPTPEPTATPTPEPTPVLVDTVIVDSADPAGASSTVVLDSTKQYRFVVSGTWTNSANVADAEYTSIDAWANYMNGYDIDPYFLGEGAFDLQVDSAFVDWGAYSATNEYTLEQAGADSTVTFRVFDGNSNTNTQEIGWYGDNSGNLTVMIYELP